jgi:hypothetical protein
MPERSWDQVLMGIHVNLLRARAYGYVVSEATEDGGDIVPSYPGTHTVRHFTTVRLGRCWSYLPCEVRRPMGICPCGQVTVCWEPHPDVV